MPAAGCGYGRYIDRFGRPGSDTRAIVVRNEARLEEGQSGALCDGWLPECA